MSWKELIQPNTGVWHGIELYVTERVTELTQVCITAESSEADIRQAQAGIVELQRLVALPQIIGAEAQIRGQRTRKEY